MYTLTLTHWVWVLTLTCRKPGQTRTHGHGYGFGQVGVWVGQKYPRVTPVDHYIHLGSEKEHTVHEAKLMGILLAMQLISMERCGSTSFAIAVDNQAAIQLFHLELRNPGHHLSREIIQIANQVQK